MAQPLWKVVCQLLKTLNIHLPYDLLIPLLEIHAKEKKIIITYYILIRTCVHAKTCTQMFIAALFVIAKTT